MRIRHAAETLGVSEAQLLATSCGTGVVRLSVVWRNFLSKELPALGVVKAITRNDHVVHERVGAYKNPSFKEKSPVGLFVGEDIDLRLFLHHWHLAFSVTEDLPGKKRYSLQFFNHQGMALHKVYLSAQSDLSAFSRITDAYKSADQSVEQPPIQPPAGGGHRGRETSTKKALDVTAFQAAWLGLKDTHDFHLLLQKFGLNRLDALSHAPRGYQGAPSGCYALRLNDSAFRSLLTEVAIAQIPIMVFVGNQGMLQIHTGHVKKVVDARGWFNVLDPDFNLHVREEAIAQSWLVRKPTEDGMVSSLEIFDKKGELLCTLFGKRKPGIKEDLAWRQVLDALEDTHRFAPRQ